MDERSLLKKSALCQHLNEKELEDVLTIVSIRRVSRSEILFFQGDEATGFFVLLKGKMRIYKSSPEGREYTLHVITPGQMFAEAAIFHGRGFPASSSALEDSVVAFFPKGGFVRLLGSSPEISMKMIAALSAYLRELAEMIEELSLKEIPSRLASYLLTESSNRGLETFNLQVTKTELAHKLGTISETLSRNLKKMKALGLIAVNGREIKIMDFQQLRAVADGRKI